MDNNQVETNRTVVYSYDPETSIFSGMRYEASDYKLAANETLVAPKDGLRPPYHWNGAEWTEASVTEFNEKHPGFKVGLTPTTQAINILGQQLVQAKQDSLSSDEKLNAKLDKLTESVNMLGQMLAKQGTTKEEVTNG